MKDMGKIFAAFCAASFGAHFAVATPVHAAEMFEGKTIKIIVGFGPGGGNDIYARQLAKYIGKYLPGNPNAIVQNMTGAGSLRAANYIYNQAPKDGTEMGLFSRALPVLAFGGETGQVRFDPLKINWVGTSSSNQEDAHILWIRADRGITTYKDIQGRNGKSVVLGATAAGATGHDSPLILREALGLNISVVHGYPGGATVTLAVNRGEMDGRTLGISSVKGSSPDWLDRSKMIPMMQFGTDRRHPEFPDVPLASELVTTSEGRGLLQLMEAPFLMSRPFATAPDIPADRLMIVRDAFMKAHADPGYIQDAATLQMERSPLDGERVQEIVGELSRISRDLYDRYSQVLANPKSAARQVEWQIVTGTIKDVDSGGRFTLQDNGKILKSRVISDYTKLTVQNKEAKTDSLVAGMTCKIWFEGNDTDAGQMECSK